MSKSSSTKLQFLCTFSELEDPSSRGFSVKIKRKTSSIFIIRKNDQIFGYENNCPHAQAPLEWNPDEFLDDKREIILCAMHGAEFSIENGDCLGGPCNGVGLTPIELLIKDNDIFLV